MPDTQEDICENGQQAVAPDNPGEAACDAGSDAASEASAGSAQAPAEGPEPEEPHVKGKVVNLVLCAVAFAILFIFLFVVGEAGDLAEAVSNMRWGWLALGVALVVLYWILESTCMQIFANQMWPGFSFLKTNVVTVIGQYFNCITPLSSGGQPFQVYYYYRFGMPLSKSMPMLLCRFISYQLATTLYCAVMLVARFGYFSSTYSGLMVLVVIGFVGGLGLMTFLLLLAFWKRGTLKATRAIIRLGYRLHIVKDLSAAVESATSYIEDSYREVHYLVHEPKLLLKASGVTFIQLTEYFAISYVIYRGFGFNSVDFITIISCQAFVYMISSFVPTPGAMGAAEGSYALFFSLIYPNASYVALSTFIWRLLTFYLPIVVGMATTLVVNRNPGGKKRPAEQAVAAGSSQAEIAKEADAGADAAGEKAHAHRGGFVHAHREKRNAEKASAKVDAVVDEDPGEEPAEKPASVELPDAEAATVPDAEVATVPDAEPVEALGDEAAIMSCAGVDETAADEKMPSEAATE